MKKSLFSFLGATALLVTFTACNNGPSEAEVEKMRADSLAKAQATADSILAAESAAKAKATQDSIDAAAVAAPVPAVAPVAVDKKGGKPTPKPAKKPVMKPATKPTTTKVEPVKVPEPPKQDPGKAQVGGKGGAGAVEVKAQVGGKGGAGAVEEKAKIGGK